MKTSYKGQSLKLRIRDVSLRHHIQAGPGVYPLSCPRLIAVLSQEVSQPESKTDPSPSSSAEVGVFIYGLFKESVSSSE